MLHYDRTDLIKGNNITKIDNSKKCMVCHYWFFNHALKFQDSVCNGSSWFDERLKNMKENIFFGW